MIRINIRDTDTGREAFVEIPSVFGPALRSAIEDLSNEIGGRLEGIHVYQQEDALTEAAAALGPLRAGVNRVVPEGHVDHDNPTPLGAKHFWQDAREAIRPLREAVNTVVTEGHEDYA